MLGQQLSIAATRKILDRLLGLFGGRLPSPRQIRDTSSLATLRRAGMSRRKAETLQRIAREFAEGRLTDRQLRTLSDDEIEARLTQIPGIGPWTVHGFLIIALDRPDVILPGDLALRRAIQHLYRLRQLPSPEEVLRIAEPWRPYRSLATSYLFASELEAGP